ncbi:MAG: phosphate/phosphite/phosphonate ABC transporter substrate-binding protein [Dehalococcoidia bacterium]
MTNHPIRITILALTLMTSVALMGACGDDDDGGDPLVIAVQPTATQSELTDQAAEMEAFLEERLDVDVEIRFPTSYGGVVESLRFGHADAAFMGAWPASIAAAEADAEVVLAEVREVTIGDEFVEEPFYYSYWVVPPDSEAQSLVDLEGARVAFSSQLSTSGYVAPLARMVELGLIDAPADGEAADAGQYFDEVFFAGGYSQAWEALQAGQVDVSIIAGDVPADLYQEVLDNTRVIEEQGPLPSHAVLFANDLEEPLRGQLKNALLELGEEQHRELMRQFVSGIFVRFEETTTEEHLGALDRFLGDTGLAFTETLR